MNMPEPSLMRHVEYCLDILAMAPGGVRPVLEHASTCIMELGILKTRIPANQDRVGCFSTNKTPWAYIIRCARPTVIPW